ncbi:MAG: division/cell wall cluster transcriptional repressor MraZ [Candidatus Nealsonbacteria bacterium]
MLCGNFKRSIDGHGRICIPGKLKNVFGKEEVVVAGCGDHIEIWSKERWAIEQVKMQETLDKTNR